MNFFERKVARFAWGYVVKRMPILKRWGPVLGTAVLVAVVALRYFGQGDAANALDAVGRAIGVTTDVPVSLVEMTAAIGGFVGVVLKIVSVVREAMKPREEFVSVPRP